MNLLWLIHYLHTNTASNAEIFGNICHFVCWSYLNAKLAWKLNTNIKINVAVIFSVQFKKHKQLDYKFPIFSRVKLLLHWHHCDHSPIRTTGQDFLHSCRHFFGLQRSLLTMAIRVSLSWVLLSLRFAMMNVYPETTCVQNIIQKITIQN